MEIVKALTVRFNDGSEVTINNDMSATVTGHSESFARVIWKVASRDIKLRSAHLHLFDKIVKQLDAKHRFIVSYEDHGKAIEIKAAKGLIQAC